MNKRIKELLEQSGLQPYYDAQEVQIEKFAELIVEATLDQVKERAYYTGNRDWSDEVDRPWIQLEFGYGPLADAQKQAGIIK